MSRKIGGCVCGMCGAELSGIGDWVEHVCPNLMPEVPGDSLHMRRPRSRAPAIEAHDNYSVGNLIVTAFEPPTRTFEELLTAEDRALDARDGEGVRSIAGHPGEVSEVACAA